MNVDIYPANPDGRTFSNEAEGLNIPLSDIFPGEGDREDREIVAAELANYGRSIFGGGAVPVVLIIPTECGETLPVVDGDEGADIYGHASTVEEAKAIATAAFVDPIDRVERHGPVRLRDGRSLPVAFVAFTREAA